VVEPLLIAAIASEHRSYRDSTIDPRWLDQLGELGLTSRPFAELNLTDWARSARHGRYVALHTALALAGFLQTLPSLADCSTPRYGVFAPGPGVLRSRGQPEGAGQDPGAAGEGGGTEFPEEAEALSAKAQELMAKFSLDRALVEADPATDPADGSAARRIWVETPYVAAKAQLVGAVAAANRCRTVSMDRLAWSPSSVPNSTATHRTAQHVAAGAGEPGDARRRTARGVLRRIPDPLVPASFLMAYAQRIGERLQATAEPPRRLFPRPTRIYSSRC